MRGLGISDIAHGELAKPIDRGNAVGRVVTLAADRVCPTTLDHTELRVAVIGGRRIDWTIRLTALEDHGDQ